MAINWVNVSKKAMELNNQETKVLHVNKIAELIQKESLVKAQTESILKSVNSALARNVKLKNNRIFSKSTEKGRKRGYYYLKRKRNLTEKFIDPLQGDKYAKHFTGKAGEHAVLSELLFRGFNAGHFAVDVGMDLIATKNNKSFNIQVKTANISDKHHFTTIIKDGSFEHATHIFYIIVLREDLINTYFIITSDGLRQLKRKNILSGTNNINIKIEKKPSGYWIGNEKIDNHIDDFDSIS